MKTKHMKSYKILIFNKFIKNFFFFVRIKNDFFLKEKKISYEELKDTFIQVQLELNQVLKIMNN